MEIKFDSLWDGTPGEPGEGARIKVSRDGSLMRIEVEATLYSDPEPPTQPGPCDGLWEYEVVELFIAGLGDEYLEIELGPHGHYLILGLKGERNIVERCLMVDYRTVHAHGRWRGVGFMHLTLLPKGPHRVNAYSIHGSGDKRRYSAWRPVPGDEPDFHQLDSFERIRVFGS
tara:strand:- start:20 stop:535 length:516 start_codon:yes stop_codon:yes gene_type:complete